MTVTPEYWKEKVLPRLAPTYRPNGDGQDAYLMALHAASGSVSHDFDKYGGPDFSPGTYSAELPHGTGQLVLRVWGRRGRDSQGWMVLDMVIKDDIALEPNATTKIMLE